MTIFSWHLEHWCLLSEDQLISIDLASAFLTPQGMLKDSFRCLFDVIGDIPSYLNYFNCHTP